jgi:hypothetical protein
MAVSPVGAAGASSMVFRFKSGGANSDIVARPHKAQAVGEALARLSHENDGVIAARDVVAEARVASSPLHEFFEWDDSAAAREHRLHQAKKLVKAVVVQVPDSDVELPAFSAVANDEKKKRGIAGHEEAFAPAGTPKTFTMPLKTRRDSLEEARRDLEKFRRAYAALDELGPVMRSIDDQMRDLDAMLLEEITRPAVTQ